MNIKTKIALACFLLLVFTITACGCYSAFYGGSKSGSKSGSGPTPAQAPSPSSGGSGSGSGGSGSGSGSYKLRDAKTEANEMGGGNAIFLDRHLVDCDDDGLNQFKLGRPSETQISYSYKCLDGIDSPANIEKNSGANDWGGGNTIFLDRHNVDCGDNPIAKFKLVRPTEHTIRYDYTCNSKKVTGSCTDLNTGWNEESDKNIFLDRHDVKCDDNQVITQFKLNRDGNGKFRYDYKCCEM